jgi:nitrite reductase/ring-hydroxylating ferredoxin subunit
VHLVGVDGETVHLQFAGSCKSCPSSAVTLELAVEDAVRAAAPEISMIEVVAEEKSSTSGVIPPDSLMTRVHADGHRAAAWQPVPDLAELAPGEVGGFSVAGSVVLACRVGEDFFAYRDRCAACGASMAGTQLRGEVLRCPQCNTGYDAVHAGVGVGSAVHLEPLPVLIREGLLSMALPAEEVAS